MSNLQPPCVAAYDRPPAVVHIDLDGMTDIYRAHGWSYPHADDPVFGTGLLSSLEFFDRNGVRATLFVVANSLDDPRKLELVQEAVRRGHEIASHSLTHAKLSLLDHEQKRREIEESHEKLEKLLGVPVRGFRAPAYHIDRACISLLAHCGYAYDASIFPNPSFARRLEVPMTMLAIPQRSFLGTGLVELPMPSYHPLPFPFNPSYALLLGMGYFRLGFRRFVKRKAPMVLLFHLIDMADPVPCARLKGLKARVFTLSTMSREHKREQCQRMVDLVFEYCRPMTTSALLEYLRLCWGHEAQGQSEVLER